jgi:hypothetical protein
MINRASRGPLNPLTPGTLVRHTARAESDPGDRTVLGCAIVVDRTGGWTELANRGGKVGWIMKAVLTLGSRK